MTRINIYIVCVQLSRQGVRNLRLNVFTNFVLINGKKPPEVFVPRLQKHQKNVPPC